MPVRIDASAEALDPYAGRVRLLCRSEPPERFNKIRVFDRFNRPVTVDQPPQCVTFWEALTPPVPRDAFPLYAEAAGCDGAPDTPRGFNGPLLPNFVPGPAVPVGGSSCMVRCEDNAACNDALAAGFAAQARLQMACNEQRRLRVQADESERDGLILILVGVAALITGAVMVGIGFAVVIGWILLAVGTLLLIAGTAALQRAAELRGAANRLDADIALARSQVEAAIAAAGSACCPGCGTTMPSLVC